MSSYLTKKVIYTESDRCLKCSKFVTNNQKGICCDICNHWLHVKCSLLTLKAFNVLKNNNETWMCNFCCESTFPFHNLDKSNFLKSVPSTLTKNIPQKVENFNKTCSICIKKVLQPKLSVPCLSCKTFIHKKCSYFKNSSKPFPTNWMCSLCIKLALPFSTLVDNDFFEFQYNSNFHCLCTKNESRALVQEVLPSTLPSFNAQNLILNPNEFCANSDPDDNIQLNADFGYYSTHDFHKKTKLIPEKHFSLFHTNIQSLNCNFDKLEYLLYSLEPKFDIIGLSETWNPKSKTNFSPGILLGYQPYHGSPGFTNKSGCGFYISDYIKFLPRTDLDISFKSDHEEFQASWIEIINQSQSNALVGVFYRHPHKQNSEEFMKYLQNTLAKLKNNSKKIMICGDFNYDLIKQDSNKCVRNFLNTIFENFLQPHILQPTRFIKNNKPSLIDNIFTNKIESNCISGNILSKISDHLPNFIISNDNYKFKTKLVKTERDFKHFSEEKYMQSLSKTLKTIEFSDNVNDSFNSFHKCLINTLDKHAPLKNITRKEAKLKLKPWLTTGILKSIQIKNATYKKFIRTKDNFLYIRYKHYRNRIDKLIRLSKKNFYKSYFFKFKHNSRKIWIGIKEILIKQKISAKHGIMLYENDTIISNQKSVSNKFCKFFTNIASDLVSKLPTSTKNYSDYLHHSQPNSFFSE